MDEKDANLDSHNSFCQNSEEKYKRLYDFAPSGYVTLSREGEITELNFCAANILGQKRSLLIKNRFGLFVSEDSLNDFNLFFQNIFKSKKKESCEVSLKTKSNSLQYIHLDAIMSEDSNECMLTMIDITDRKQLEEKLRESEELRKTLKEQLEYLAYITLDALSTHVAVLNEEGTILAVNRAWRAFAETNSPDLSIEVNEGANYFSVCQNSDEGLIMLAGIHSVINGSQKEFTFEYPSHSPGEKRWFNARVTRFIIGGAVRIVIAHENITEIKQAELYLQLQNQKIQSQYAELQNEIKERKQAEKALKESEEVFRSMANRYHTLLHTSNDGIHILDINGNILEANEAFCNMLGYSKEEVLRLNVSDWDLKIPKDELSAIIQGIIKTPRLFETSHRRKDGRIIQVEINGTGLYLDGASYLYVAARDITERKELEYELLESEKKLKTIFDILDVGIAITDNEGNIIDCNKASEQILGLTKEQYLAGNYAGLERKVLRPDLTVMPANEYASVRAMNEKRSISNVEMGVLKPDGNISWIMVNATPLELPNYGVAISYVDFTELKKIEQELRALITEMQTGLAVHEIICNEKNEPIDYRFLYVNESFEKQTGLKKENVIGKTVMEILPKTEKFWIEKYGHVALTGDKLSFVHFSEELGKYFEVVVYRTFPMQFAVLFTDVTERRQLEEKIHSTALYTRSLIEASLDPLVTISAEGKITDVNYSTEEATGILRNKLIGTDFSNYFTEPEKARIGYQKVFEQGYVIDYPLAIQHISGSIIDVLYNARVYKNELGEVLGVFAAARDITEQKLAEQLLKESEEKYRLLFEYMTSGFQFNEVVLDENKNPIDFRFLDGNSKMKNYTGFSIEEVKGKTIKQVMPNADSNMIQKYCAVALTGKPFTIEYFSLTFNKYFKVNAYSPKKGYFAVVYEDITDRMNYENTLKKWEHIFKNAEWGIVVGSADGRTIEMMNPAFAYMHGYEIDELIGQPIENLFASGDRNSVSENINIAHEKGHHAFESIHIRKDGSIFPVIIDITTVKDENGEALYRVVNVLDITDRKKSENALFESELKFRTVADYTYGWEYWNNEKGQIIYMSPSCERITGYTQDDFIRDPDLLQKIVHPEDAVWMNQHFEEVHSHKNRNEINEIDFRIIKKDTSVAHINHICRPVFNQDNKYVGRRVSNRDITEKKKAEEIIQQKNKELTELNASKDKFFSIIAHDLKSPFTAFLGLTKVMLTEEITQEEMQSFHVDLNEYAQKLYRLLENLLTWSRMQGGAISFKPEECSLSEIFILNLSILSANSKQKNIEISYNFFSSLKVLADFQMLNTIIRNLLSNAIKFTKKNGKITILAEIKGEEVLICIQDTGIGMDAKTMDGIFRIDQKTARPGTEGESSTGLGLLLCKEFVEKNGGKIWVESEIGKGSAFYFTLRKSPTSVESEVKIFLN